MESQQLQNTFRSEFINNVISLFYSAETMVNDSLNRMAANRENYKGQLLDERNHAEKQLRQRNLETVCNQIAKIRDAEIELLTKKKESELRQPPNGTLGNLTNLKDIITEEELQIYADKCRGSTLIQRRIQSIAQERNLHINTYPDFNKKSEAVHEIASAFIRYIKAENFGLEAALYIETAMTDYDKMLG